MKRRTRVRRRAREAHDLELLTSLREQRGRVRLRMRQLAGELVILEALEAELLARYRAFTMTRPVRRSDGAEG